MKIVTQPMFIVSLAVLVPIATKLGLSISAGEKVKVFSKIYSDGRISPFANSESFVINRKTLPGMLTFIRQVVCMI